MTRRTFSSEFRRKVAEEHLVGGRTIAAICRAYHLGRNHKVENVMGYLPEEGIG